MARRKIPVRKHHGVRDPIKQKEDRELKLKKVTNNPPAGENDQKVSGRFAEFRKLIDDTKAGRKQKKPHAGTEDKPKTKEPIKNKVRTIRQLHNEEDTDYLRRVNRMTTESLREAQYEVKYGVTVHRNPETGEIIVKKKPKNELDELLKQKQKEKSLGKGTRRRKKEVGKGAKPLDPQLAKELVKQAIKEDDEERRHEASGHTQEYTRDVFKFGEVVNAPPTLSTLPRKAQKSDTVPRPGMKNNLLLKTLLHGNFASATATVGSDPAKSSKTAKTKTGHVTKAEMRGKRKDLPAATRSMLEKEQSKMIDLYRQLKKAKMEATTTSV